MALNSIWHAQMVSPMQVFIRLSPFCKFGNVVGQKPHDHIQPSPLCAPLADMCADVYNWWPFILIKQCSAPYLLCSNVIWNVFYDNLDEDYKPKRVGPTIKLFYIRKLLLEFYLFFLLRLRLSATIELTEHPGSSVGLRMSI